MKIFVLTFLFLYSLLSPAQETNNYKIIHRSISDVPTFITFGSNSDITATNFFDKLKQEFNFWPKNAAEKKIIIQH